MSRSSTDRRGYTSKFSDRKEGKLVQCSQEKQLDSSKGSAVMSAVPEDTRISKMLRRLVREEDADAFVTLCNQLEDAFELDENERYIFKAMDFICESMLDVLHSAPLYECKLRAAKCLGHLGLALDNNAIKYLNWVFNKCGEERNVEVRLLLLKSVHEMLLMDRESLILTDCAVELAIHVQRVLESSDVTQVLLLTAEIMILLLQDHVEAFAEFYKDTVDILIGWYIDIEQPPTLMKAMSVCLRLLSPHLKSDLSFTIGLLGQIIDDMVQRGKYFVRLVKRKMGVEDVDSSSDEDEGEPTEIDLQMRLAKTILFMKVYNALMKTIAHPHATSVPGSDIISPNFLSESLKKLLHTTLSCLEIEHIDEELVVTANECLYLLVSLMQAKISAHPAIYRLLCIELQLMETYQNHTIASVLQLIAKVVREGSASLPPELINILVGPKSYILQVRLSTNIHIHNGVIAVYHSVLSLKNIPLLQEGYRLILGDLERVHLAICTSAEPFCADNPFKDVTYSEKVADCIMLFYMKALSDLANSGSSIIGLWALQPCILELLAVKLNPANKSFNCLTRFAILSLLHFHCLRYSNFISSSELVTSVQGKPAVTGMLRLIGSDVSSQSPTGSHLTIILNLLTSLLKLDLNEQCFLLVSRWISELLTQSQQYISPLLFTNQFLQLMQALIRVGSLSTEDYVVNGVYANLKILLHNTNICALKSTLLEDIAELCFIRMTSINATVRNNYRKLLLCIPWSSVISVLKKLSKKSGGPFNDILVACKHHMSQGSNREIAYSNLETLLDYFSGEVSFQEQMEAVLESFFLYCDIRNNKNTKFGKIVPSLSSALLFWETWECARYCITNKLKTPLGKSPDMFTTVEELLTALVYETFTKYDSDISAGVSVRKVHLFLEFIEQLEKLVYNASEGTANALPELPKSICLFFAANKPTCAEWFDRNRWCFMLISANVGQSTSTIRHGYSLLESLLAAGDVKELDFENIVRYVAWSLYTLNESEAIFGLYRWCLKTASINFSYLEALGHQAANKYELSAEQYRLLIKSLEPGSQGKKKKKGATPVEDVPEPVSDSLKAFISDQLTDCYLNVNDWTQLKQWKKKEASFLSTINKETYQRHSDITVREAEIFAEIELGNFLHVDKLVKQTDTLFSWNSYELLSRMKNNLLQSFVMMSASDEVSAAEHRSFIRESCGTLEKMIAEDTRNLPSGLVKEYATLLYVTSMFSDFEDKPFINFTLVPDSKELGSKLLSDALWWTHIVECLQGPNPSLPRYYDRSELRLELAKSARKEGNIHLASRQLLQHFDSVLSPYRSCEKSSDNDPYNTLLKLWRNQATLGRSSNIWSIENTDALLQFAKLINSSGDVNLAIDIGALTTLGVVRSGGSADPLLRDRTSRLLLYLSKWLSISALKSADNVPAASQELASLLEQNINTLSPSSETINISLSNTLIPPKEEIVGRLLKICVVQSPMMGKAWHHFADWCYKWGRKVVDKQSDLLHVEEKNLIDSLLPPDVTSKEDIYAILTHTKPSVDEVDIEAENVESVETIEWKLRNVATFTDEQMKILIEIWRKSHMRAFTYYHLSAKAYFRYLQMCDSYRKGANIITATLRLLRLIVKYSPQLQTVLEIELTRSPTSPWKSIIPQLFSRLNHPEGYVRMRISELLCRLASDAPHLIIFPAVVGSDYGTTGAINHMPTANLIKSSFVEESESSETVANEEMMEDLDEEEEEEDVTGQEDNTGNSHMLENCYKAIVDTLARQAPDTISEVQLFVNELRRITLLWDELWHGALSQHHADMARRIKQLEIEITRVDNNPHLSELEKDRLVREKYNILIRPLLFILEQLQAVTSVKPETPHEKWFQSKYGDLITKAIHMVQNPKDFRTPSDAWKVLKELQSCFQHNANRRSSHTLKMTSISPALAALKNSKISMPGLEQCVTISSVHNHLNVMPTKTKPKKLVFQGSDGKMYPYLFKGLEDLHLDERIMQFLSVANTMMRGTDFYARHYSVVPLGPRSGLISWVEHATSVFTLYKRWQQRAASENQDTPTRPSEIFYSKLIPLLKEHGITNIENRKEWPLPVLKNTLLALMEETPKDLLSRELWCQSVNSGSWWKITKLYSTSLAVMSVIGYIIGLGDRHLDNVLIHLATGEVVHIDYNVCFEKGKTLRIPEKVPFRLTPNFITALGVTGIEGIFRSSCEKVLNIMKAGKETLLTLLETFVYDPLIDWTPGVETGYTGAVYGGDRAVALKNKQNRRQLEQEVTSVMLSIRMTEIKQDWFDNRTKLQSELPKLAVNVDNWIRNEEKLVALTNSIAENHQLLALLKAAEAHPQHELYTVYNRYMRRKEITNASVSIHTAMNSKLQECDAHLTQYKVVFYHLQSGDLLKWSVEMEALCSKKYKVFDCITEFLVSAGQSQMVQQCTQAEKDLDAANMQQGQLSIECLELLKKYSTIAAFYPSHCIYNHRCSYYKRWLLALMEYPGQNVFKEVMKEFEKVCSVPNKEQLSKQVKKYSENVQKAITETENSLKSHTKKLEKFSAVAEEAVLECEQLIKKCAEEHEQTLQCAVIIELCNLNKKFLKMETAAAGAGDSLSGLTSIDGEWFLDDMCIITENVNRLLSYIVNQEMLDTDPNIHLVKKCLSSLNEVYRCLQEMNLNFATVIVPESVKKFLIEDESVLQVMTKLNQIIESCGVPPVELINKLRMHLRFVVMGMPSSHTESLKVAQELKSRYAALINEYSVNPVLPGQMLLIGFNGLFQNLYNETAKLFLMLPLLAETSVAWKSIDVIKDTRSIIGPIFNTECQPVLKDIFLSKHLLTMQEFFAKCHAMAVGFKGGPNVSTVYYTNDQMNKLMKKFTADYLRQQLLGLFSYTLATTICLLLQHVGFSVTAEVEQRDIGAENKVPLKDLCHKAVEQKKKKGDTLTGNNFGKVLSVLTNIQNLWKRSTTKNKLKQDIESEEMMLLVQRIQFTVHLWIHDSVTKANVMSPSLVLNRSDFLSNLKRTVSSLITIHKKIVELRSQYTGLVSSVVQRLKWASGANPAVNEMLNEFEKNVTEESEHYTVYQQLAASIINVCTTVLHFESLRVKTQEATLSDNTFIELVKKYQAACNQATSASEYTLTAAEESLVKLLPPTCPVDIKWINKADDKVSETVKELSTQMEPIRYEAFALEDFSKAAASTIRSILLHHHRILGDVRNLLRTMIKFEENGGLNEVPNYLARHKAFVEQLNTLTKEISTGNFSLANARHYLHQIESIQQQIPYIYEQLINFSSDRMSTSTVRSVACPPFTRQDSVTYSSPHTNFSSRKATQEKNTYAVNVWRRVRMKLEGQDPDKRQKLSAEDQVSWAIKEATDIENLAVLYEGWTPWV